MYQHTILGMTAITPVHAGASSADGAVDLPIQRESSTDWPVIAGSGVKGAFRGHFEFVLGKANCTVLKAAYGPDSKTDGEAIAHAGALLFSDAKLLLLPVRSMTSHVKWVTCPALLKRVLRDWQFSGKAVAEGLTVPSVQTEEALVVTDLADNSPKTLFLEEYRFNLKSEKLAPWIAFFKDLAPETDIADFERNLVVVDNDAFRYLCRAAIPASTRIALDSATKTNTNGALWSEESLPADTLMYLCLSATNARSKDCNLKAIELLEWFWQTLDDKPYVQMGGNSTVGMGWFQLAANMQGAEAKAP